MNEVERIKAAYQRRDESGKTSFYSRFNDATLFIMQQRERELLTLLLKHGINNSNINEKKILDVGCGNGFVLRKFIEYGAEPRNLFGIDLLSDRIELAKKISPSIEFLCDNAEQLPYSNDFFDIILCFTVFSSIINKNMMLNIANEMIRVVKHEGIILWYDYFYNNPKNRDVRGIKKREILSLFPNCKIDLKKITLAPPIARKLAPISWILAYCLEKLSFLNTHYLGTIIKL